MAVTIRQIAEQAGVSRGTVDRVLNGRARVKPQVRERVLLIAKQLNYIPNAAAKALAYSKKPAQFGVVMPPKEIRFFDDVRGGLTQAADELKDFGIRLDYRYVDIQNGAEASAAVRELADADVGGILFAAMDSDPVRDSIDYAHSRGVPVITFNSDVEQSRRLCFIGQDLYKSGKVAAGLMSKLFGRGEVYVIVGSLLFQAHRARLEGFRHGLAELAERGGGIEIVGVAETFNTWQAAWEAVDRVLTERPDLSGIYIAAGVIDAVMDAVKRHNLQGKVRIVCNDLLPEVQQGLREGVIDFTISQDPWRQGYQALRNMYDYVFFGKQPEREFYYTDTHIFTGESL